jgi:hypothetical protein
MPLMPEDQTIHIHQATIRRIQKSDNMAQLTKLIHDAYGQNAAKGLRYWGTHQSVDNTVRRFQSGQGLLAELNGKYVGTVVVRPPWSDSPVALYREPNVWSISQFAVAPQYKG